MTTVTILRSSSRGRRRDGATLILVTFMLLVVFTLAFFAIDIASLQREHVNNQVVSDLASQYGASLTTETSDRAEIQRYVDAIVNENFRNRLGKSSDKEFSTEYGSVNPNTMEFERDAEPLNSVRVTATSKLTTFGFMDRKSQAYNVFRDATAAAFNQDVCVVVDRSSSMCFLDNVRDYPDTPDGNVLLTTTDPVAKERADDWWKNWAEPNTSRWARLIDALYAFAFEMDRTPQDEQFSIVSYSHNHAIRFWDHDAVLRRFDVKAAELESAPTKEYSKAVRRLQVRYRDEQLVYGYTNITAGIEEGTRVLTSERTRKNAFKTMIVMTDGEYNHGGSPVPAAAKAAEEGIRVVTVTFGSDARQSDMQEVAAAGGGQHFHAEDGAELLEAFKVIANIPPGALVE